MSFFKRTIYLGLDYSEFKGGVKECNDKMKLLDNKFALCNETLKENGTRSEKTAVKMEYLTQKINLQQQKVKS